MSYLKKIIYSLVVSIVLAGCGTVETKPEKKITNSSTLEDSRIEPSGNIEAPHQEAISAETVSKLMDSEIPPPISSTPSGIKNKKTEPDATIVASESINLAPGSHIISLRVKSEKHPFFGIGDKRGFIIDGIEGKELILKRGKSYQFQVNSTPMHDVYISEDEMGWGAKVVEGGVEGNFTFDGVLTFTPDKNTPDVVFYQCQNHKAMGARFFVVDQRDSRTLAELTREYGTLGVVDLNGRNLKTSSADVKQKLSYAGLVAISKPAKRVRSSNNLEAKALFELSRKQLVEARKLQSSGDNDGAMALVDEALRNMGTASQMVPSDALKNEQVARYNGAVTLLAQQEVSYKKAYDRLLKEGIEVIDYDENAVSKYKISADQYAGSGDHTAAISDIQQADRIVTTALNKMLDSQTVKYELNLDTPEGEFKYEHNRYLGYAELVPVAIDEKKPSAGQLMLLNRFVKKSEEMSAKGEELAHNKNYPDAIRLMQEATKQVRRALRMLGVKQ